MNKFDIGYSRFFAQFPVRGGYPVFFGFDFPADKIEQPLIRLFMSFAHKHFVCGRIKNPYYI
jgi:hypothetical protein